MNLNDLYWALTESDLEKVKEIIDSGVHPDSILPRTEQTLIFRAINFGSVDIVKFLISEGCNVNFVDKHGTTPFLFAVEYTNLEIFSSRLNPEEATKLNKLMPKKKGKYKGIGFVRPFS